MSGALFQPKRVCCACACEATPNSKKPVPGEPRIVAISLTIYRRGNGKGELKAAPRVQICEACLIRALAGSLFGAGREGSKLWGALRGSISYRFESMLADDQLQADDPAIWKSVGDSLPFPSKGGRTA